ncbi:hypothetical protein [Micromonospora sp. NPDC049274]|uniref:hypothetical protein n=1 Tax=Micromonospora sp. NPDC049274 TaxID=3154829 RepID=UPI00341F4F5C
MHREVDVDTGVRTTSGEGADDATTTSDEHTPGRVQGHAWAIDEVRDLGVTTDVETAAAILGIGRTKAYELACEQVRMSAVASWCPRVDRSTIERAEHREVIARLSGNRFAVPDG